MMQANFTQTQNEGSIMEYVTLNNGIKMPKLGYGVYQTPPEDTKRCVLDAIDVGYAASILHRLTATKRAWALLWKSAACPVKSSS